jgi:putative Holliday junction resolvase
LRILAIDPGDARIGLAISDPNGVLASPLVIIKHESRASNAMRISQLADENDVELIIVGNPLDAEGLPTLQSRKAKRLAAAIRDAGHLPVELWDESGSTQTAQKIRQDRVLSRKKRTEAIDALAATVILQTYLNDHQESSSD